MERNFHLIRRIGAANTDNCQCFTEGRVRLFICCVDGISDREWFFCLFHTLSCSLSRLSHVGEIECQLQQSVFAEDDSVGERYCFLHQSCLLAGEDFPEKSKLAMTRWQHCEEHLAVL